MVVEDGAILGVGAVVLVSKGTVTLGRGSIVGANSVLTRSTAPGEIWAGNPARRIRHRDDDGRRTAEVSPTKSSVPSLV